MGFILINIRSRLWTYKIDPFAGPGPVVFVPRPLSVAAARGINLDKTLANIYLLAYFLFLGP